MIRKKRGKWTLSTRGDILLWAAIILVGGEVYCSSLKQRFANEPSPQTALLGSTAVLPCRVINKKGELQWTRDDFGLGNERELYAFSRYSMIGSDEEGDFSLRISPVTLEDDAEFQCQVTGWRNIDGVRSQSAKLTVHVPPEAPEITQGNVVQSNAGATVKLECIAHGGKPAAEIQWLDSSGRVILDGVKFTKSILDDGHRYDSKSILTFIADRSHHNSVLTCSSTNPALKQPRKTQVRLDVTFPPVVRITHSKEGYREGEDAILTCTAYANPNIVTYSWYRAGKLVSTGNQTALTVRKVTRKDKLEDITCEVSNDVSTSNQLTRIDVHYGPAFKVNPKDVFASKNENVTLKCEVDGSPPPKVVWIPQKNSSFIYGSGPELYLIANEDTIGTYLCLAKVDGFPEISTTVGLFLKGPPVVTSDELQRGKVGDVGQVTCYVPSSTPNSVHINWFKDKLPVDLMKEKYSIEKERLNHGVLVKLTIRNLENSDFGTYNCSVQNGFGSAVAQVSYQKEETFPVMLVVICIIAGFFFVLVGFICLFVYRKRKHNNTKDNKEGGGLSEKNAKLKPTEQTSVGGESDLKVEIEGCNGGRGSAPLSNKEIIFEPTWEAKIEPINPPTYLSNNSAYLYPENYNGFSSAKMNGQVLNSVATTNMGEYFGRTDSSSITSTTMSEQLGIPSVYNNLSSNSFSQRPQTVSYLQNSNNIYSVLHKDFESGHTESLEGLRGLSSTYSNGFIGHSLKSSNPTSTLPLSLHLNRSVRTGSPIASGNIVTTNGHRPSTGNCTIPRLGIPSDTSHYIVSPRTQLLQGALATHV